MATFNGNSWPTMRDRLDDGSFASFAVLFLQETLLDDPHDIHLAVEHCRSRGRLPVFSPATRPAENRAVGG
eukprot:2913090-Pyramimonas_sp.AAC.1